MKFIEKEFKIDLIGLLELVFRARHDQNIKMAELFSRHTGAAAPSWMTATTRDVDMLHLFLKGQRILGGFARQLARGRKKDKLLRYLRDGGDIDCFYASADGARNSVGFFADRGIITQESVSGICQNYGGSLTGMKIQIVEKITGSTAELFETFDLVNSMFEARFSTTGNTVYVRAPQIAWDAEANNNIVIARNNTPLLIPRVWKYNQMQRLKITPQVEESMGKNIYGLLGPVELWDNPMMEHWKKTSDILDICRRRIDILPTGHLPLFVGKWLELRKNTPYGPSYRVDIAIEEIQNRIKI